MMLAVRSGNHRTGRALPRVAHGDRETGTPAGGSVFKAITR